MVFVHRISVHGFRPGDVKQTTWWCGYVGPEINPTMFSNPRVSCSNALFIDVRAWLVTHSMSTKRGEGSQRG